jgi:SAM-dependent methyltransferase
MSAHANDDTYVMGRSAEEERRLQRQSAWSARPTRQLFADAGIAPGMKVLDLGSGAGDVAMLAAATVGPDGRVIGVDTNPDILETARRRAQEAGHANITFIPGDLRAVALDDDFDAIVSRLILVHLPDPAAALRDLLCHLRPGGVVTAYEPDFTLLGEAYPPCPLYTRACSWFAQGAGSAGLELAMGFKLHQVFIDAGLGAPQMYVDALAGGSPDFLDDFTVYCAESIRSVLPLIVRGGFATEEEVGIETLGARLRDEMLSQGATVRHILFMGAWARKVS